ncbi:MAG: proton-conducting transporter membrane subunit, partial [Verrucomicrobiota bacterium]
VSALIHAATMVAAGVYMLCRIFFLLNSPALEVIAWIGGFTALLAALMAIQQNDIKRILAYSTLSQLGYMVMGVGLHGPTAAMYHLTTHAFFKALLFLGAGSVILALHHEQDIWKMGGLRTKMPTTFWTFMIGTLALCGVPPFSGFYSKDSILAAAVEHNVALFILGVLVAVLTTFYMFRLVFVAFLGNPRVEAAEHAHESPGVMTWPLRILAIPALLAGWWGIDSFIAKTFASVNEGPAQAWYQNILAPFNHSPLAALFGILATAAGFSLAYHLYAQAPKDPLPEKLGALSRAMRNRFYFDELYNAMIAATQESVAKLADWFDRWIIAGLAVRGAHGTTELFGRALRLVQTGNLQTYAFLFVAGVSLVVYFVIGR